MRLDSRTKPRRRRRRQGVRSIVNPRKLAPPGYGLSPIARQEHKPLDN